MPFKTNPLPGSLSPLSDHQLLRIAGPDAAAFLQAQTMNDVRDLAPGSWQWNGWLTPKGRVVALFALLRTGEESFCAILPDIPAAELRTLWQRYVFRSKVTLDDAVDWCCATGSGAATDAVAERADGDAGTGWCLDWSGAGARRWLWLLPVTDPALGAANPTDAAAWRDLDLRHGLPRLAPAGRERWTPHMLGLERLGAFSVRKGCYPGQEIVARTHFLGQAKRGLVALEGAIPAGADHVQDADGRTIGDLVAVAAARDFCLAVLPLGDAPADLRIADASLTPTPLLDGLRRPL